MGECNILAFRAGWRYSLTSLAKNTIIGVTVFIQRRSTLIRDWMEFPILCSWPRGPEDEDIDDGIGSTPGERETGYALPPLVAGRT